MGKIPYRVGIFTPEDVNEIYLSERPIDDLFKEPRFGEAGFWGRTEYILMTTDELLAELNCQFN